MRCSSFALICIAAVTVGVTILTGIQTSTSSKPQSAQATPFVGRSTPVSTADKLFCRAYDGVCLLTTSPLRLKVWGSRKQIAAQSYAVDPAAPFTLPWKWAVGTVANQYISVHMDPEFVVETEDSYSLDPRRSSTFCPTPTVLVPFRVNPRTLAISPLAGMPSMRLNKHHTIHFNVDGSDLRLHGPGRQFLIPKEAIARCTQIALQSPCVNGFQLVLHAHTSGDSNSTSRSAACNTFSAPLQNWYAEASAFSLRHGVPFFAFLHSPETRPTLLREDLRLVFTNSSLHPIIEGDLHVHQNSDGTTSLDVPHRDMALQFHRRLGELSIHGLTARVSLYVCVTSTQKSSDSALQGGLDDGGDGWEQRWEDEVTLSNACLSSHGVASKLPIANDTMSRVPFHPLTQDVKLLGEDAAVNDCSIKWAESPVNFFVPQVTLTAQEVAIVNRQVGDVTSTWRRLFLTVVAVARNVTIPASSSDLLETSHQELTAVKLVPMRIHSGPNSAALQLVIPGPENSGTAHGHCVASRCTLTNIEARLTTQQNGGAVVAADPTRILQPVTVKIHSSDAHCDIKLIDGFVSVFDADGIAHFPQLLVGFVGNTTSCCSRRSSVFLEVDRIFPLSASNSVTIGSPLDLGQAGLLNLYCNARARSVAASRRRTVAERWGNPIFPLWSIGVHVSIAAIVAGIVNFGRAARPNNAAVVLHISQTWEKLSAADIKFASSLLPTSSFQRHEVIETLTSVFEKSLKEPRVFINPMREREAGTRLVHLLLDGAKYVAVHHPTVRWTHLLLGHSNEMFVKPGLSHFLAGSDMSYGMPGRVRISSVSTLNSVVATGTLRKAEETKDTTFQYWGPRRSCDTRNEFGLAAVLRDMYPASSTSTGAVRRIAAYATQRVDIEGAFVNRSIALLMDDVMKTYFNISFDCAQCFCVRSEMLLHNILQTSCSRNGNTRTPPPVVDPGKSTSALQLRLMIEGATCGDRYSVMMWNRLRWQATLDDVKNLAACDEGVGPHALKRVTRTESDYVRQFILNASSKW